MKPSLVCLCHRANVTPWQDVAGYFPTSTFFFLTRARARARRQVVFGCGGWHAGVGGPARGRGKSCTAAPTTPSNRTTPPLRWRSAPAQTDARARCKKNKKMTAGARGRALAAAPREAYCHSPQVKCLRRHMERGKLTTRGEISPEQRGRLARSLPLSSFRKQNLKRRRGTREGGAIKINGVQRFDATTPTAMFAHRRRRKEKQEFPLQFSHIALPHYKSAAWLK